MGQKLKKLTLLHSNDMHGDFLAERVDDRLIGGVSMLSGYIQKVRAEEENVLFAISGDMFRGSVIDSEYRGISTIEIMNMLAPDVVTLGNHEVDYGVGHLLFLEKCARFPIINANMYLSTTQVRLFRSHIILEVDGIRILFIGVLTEEVLAQARQERLVGALVDVHDAAEEVGKICNAHRTEDIDLTVLLTHIGFDDDKALAELLDPRWGVDLIIGGHSHTYLEQPEIVAGIPIVQAVTGTDQIGRFDLVIDTESNSLTEYQWQLVPIDDSHCPVDTELETLITKYDRAANEKYERYITCLAGTYTHPARNQETELGRLFSDVFRDNLGLDLMLLASGSLRCPKLGPRVNLRDLTQMFPFEDEVVCVRLYGRQLKRIMAHLFRPEALETGETEFYQFSRGLRVVVSHSEQRITELLFEGQPIADDKVFKVGMQGYHYRNIDSCFGLQMEEANEIMPAKVLATKALDVLDENLSRMKIVKCPQDLRWISI